jgi:signal recognition particle receptor subunit beta
MNPKQSLSAAHHAANAAQEAATAAAQSTAAAAVGAAENLKNSIKDTVKDALHGTATKTTNIKENVKETVKDYIPNSHSHSKSFTDTVKETVKDYIPHSHSQSKGFGETVKETVKDYIPHSHVRSKSFTDTLKDKISDIFPHSKSHAKESVKDHVKDYVKEHVKDYVKDTAHDNLQDHVRGFFHSHVKDMHMPEKSESHHSFPYLTMPYMTVLISLFLVLLTVLFFMRKKSFKPVRDWLSAMNTFKLNNKCTVLICGPVDSGKTVLFHTLSGGKYESTQTSMEINKDTFTIDKNLITDRKKLENIQFEFIDFPGHPSQELQLGKSLAKIQGVILLVDASSSDSYLSGAKLLYSLLEKKGFTNNKIPVLICANKTDLSDAQTMVAIRGKMLDELNKLKETRPTENLEKNDEIVPVGKTDERFTWENLGSSVSFGQISAKTGNVRDVLDFLEQTCCCC